MARGIITAKPNAGGSTVSGKIIVTDGGSDGTMDDGTGTASPDGTGAASAFELGSTVAYTSGSTENEGDLVEFNIDAATGEASISSVVKSGTLITSSEETVTVAAGENVVIKGNVEGKVIVNGGILAIAENSKIGGKVESLVAGSYIFANGATVSAKVEVTGASYLSLQGTTVEGKVNSDGTAFTSVRNCIINGRLDVINTNNCKCSGNTVDGKTNTPNCI